MEWSTWALIILIVISYHQYVEPTQTNKLIQPVYGVLSNALKDKTLFNVFTKTLPTTTTESDCPDTYSPVCADGTTYDNTCLAALDNKLQVTAGECPA